MKNLFGILVLAIPLLVMPNISHAAIELTNPIELPLYTTVSYGSIIGPVESNNVDVQNEDYIGPVTEEDNDDDYNYGGSPIGPVELNEDETDVLGGSPVGPVTGDDDNYGGSPVGPVTEEEEDNSFVLYNPSIVYPGNFIRPLENDEEDNDYNGSPIGPVNENDSSDGSVIGPVDSNKDNYTVIFNPEPVNINGQDLPVHYFDEYRDSMRIDILEEDRSSTATNRIEHISLNVYDEDTDSRKMVYNLNRNDRSMYGLYTFQLDLDELLLEKSYYVTADITYANLDNLSNDYINRYKILRFVSKQDTSTPTISQEHNLSYNVDRGTTEIDGQVVHLYGTNESVNISAWQTTYSYNSPVVTDINYYIDGNMVQGCPNVNSCNLNYKLTADKKVNITIRANYKDYDEINGRFSTYSHNYDLGFFLMKADNSNINNDATVNDTTNNNAGNTDTTSTNNDTLLSMNQYLLLKGSSASVYLVNQHNNRFLIPDWSVLKSWYYQPNIIQVNDAQLGQYALLDNVIYRPGSLIKIATDPKCYTVGLNGTLHWVYNEDVARALYGTSWNKNIYIVPDSLFPSYSFADDIYNANDYEMPSFADAANMYNY